MDIHHYEKRYRRALEVIKESKDISDEDKEIIYRYNDYCLTKDISFGKIAVYLLYLRKLVVMLKKPIVKATKEDLMRVVAQFNQEDYSEETKKAFKIMLRRLYKIINGLDENDPYPEEVRWISINIKNNHKKLPESLITEEELVNIVHSAENIRDKALIATLGESGCRVSEVGLMKIKHVAFEEYGARLTVSGKTGARKILVVNSSPFLKEWINQHPFNRNPEAYLWYNPQQNGFLTYSRITAILKKATKKAGITKNIHPHLLRHSRATRLANVLSDSQLKNYLGWIQGSKMASIYIHMSGKDTDEAILKTHGVEIKREVEQESGLKSINCMRCQTVNIPTNRFCNSCGLILDQKAQKEVLVSDMKKAEANNLMDELFKDPEVLQVVLRKIKEVKLMENEYRNV